MKTKETQMELEKVKALTEKVLGECEQEYHKMWHNATLLHSDLELEPEEMDAFWFWLEHEVNVMMNNIEEEIKKKHGITMRLHGWGRSGATIAPDGFSQHFKGFFNRILDPDTIIEWDDDEDDINWWLEEYKKAKRHLAAFKLINQRVKEGVDNVGQYWQEYKENHRLATGLEYGQSQTN